MNLNSVSRRLRAVHNKYVNEVQCDLCHFDLQAILDHHFEENVHMPPSSSAVISDTVPVQIPGSPLKRSPPRQSSHESMEVVDQMLDDEGPETEGTVKVK
jgi:hypothetical protein